MVKTRDSLYQKCSLLVFRIFLSLIFVVAGSRHVFQSSAVTQRLMNIELGQLLGNYLPPKLLVISSGISMMLAGIALILGYRTHKAALVLILILIPITITVQTQGMHTLGPLFKNIGLLGGLIYFSANVSCSYSSDHKFQLQNA
jgi:putative oxidoreductase